MSNPVSNIKVTDTNLALDGVKIGAASAPSAAAGFSQIYYDASAGTVVIGENGDSIALAPVGTGTVNSQALQRRIVRWTIRTSATTPQTLDIAVASGHSAKFKIESVCRAIAAPTGGAIGDSAFFETTGGIRNVSGTCTIVGTNADVAIERDTSLATAAVTGTASSGNLRIAITPNDAANQDWQVFVTLTIN